MPDKLQSIERIIRNKKIKDGSNKKDVDITLDMIEEELTLNEGYYRDEINWIKKQIHRHYFGHWFFCNGKPTYMTGAHYTYLNWWPIGNKMSKKLIDKLRRTGLGEYRDRDRRWYITFDYVRTTKESFYQYEVQYNDGNGIESRWFNNEETVVDFMKKHRNSVQIKGQFIVEGNERTVYGMIYPKHRREGATSRAAFLNWYCTATLGMERFGGIQSLSDKHAKIVFLDHFAKRHRRLPFFFKLITDSPSVPKEEMNFSAPATRTVGSVGGSDTVTHNGRIDFAASGERAYDGTKLHFIHLDEIGKIDPKAGINIDNLMRWSVVQKCLAQGNSIHGVALLTSTLGEMTKGGGDQMKKMILAAKFNERDDFGVSRNGLLAVFFPADDGLDGFIDEFGNSVIEDPDKPVNGINGKLIEFGARTFLMARRKSKELAEDDAGLLAEMHDFPLSLRDCFIGNARNSFMPVRQISERLATLAFEEHARKGYFEWVEGRMFLPNGTLSDVRWVESDDPKKGLYKIYYMPHEKDTNNKSFKSHIIDNNFQWHPEGNKTRYLTLGVDLCRYGATETSTKNKSWHGMTMFYSHDVQEDPNDGTYPKQRHLWSSNRFILTFKNMEMKREEFCEEALKVCVFYGAMCYPEMNIDDIYRKFVTWNCAGYLKYDIDLNGDFAKLCGYTVSSGAKNTTKDDVLERIEHHFRHNTKYEVAVDLLTECKDVASPEDMTNYDLFASACAALRGASSSYLETVQINEKNYTFASIDDLMPSYNY